MPFLKNFSGKGVERRYIKDDYIARPDVLEYALWRVLNMDYYELSEPAACKALLLEYKEVNDPVRQLWAELEDEFVWDLLPYEFINDVYLKWLDKSNPGSKPLGKIKFKEHLKEIVQATSDIWWVPPREGDFHKATGSLPYYFLFLILLHPQ